MQETHFLEHEQGKTVEEQNQTAPKPKPWSLLILYKTFYLTSGIIKIIGFYVIREIYGVLVYLWGLEYLPEEMSTQADNCILGSV